MTTEMVVPSLLSNVIGGFDNLLQRCSVYRCIGTDVGYALEPNFGDIMFRLFHHYRVLLNPLSPYHETATMVASQHWCRSNMMGFH